MLSCDADAKNTQAKTTFVGRTVAFCRNEDAIGDNRKSAITPLQRLQWNCHGPQLRIAKARLAESRFAGHQPHGRVVIEVSARALHADSDDDGCDGIDNAQSRMRR